MSARLSLGFCQFVASCFACLRHDRGGRDCAVEVVLGQDQDAPPPGAPVGSSNPYSCCTGEHTHGTRCRSPVMIGRNRRCPMATITPELRQELEKSGDQPVRVEDPQTNKSYVLISAEMYDR